MTDQTQSFSDGRRTGASETIAIYSTFPDVETARRIGGGLVTLGIAACVNILPGMQSIYRWKGAIESDDEVVAIFKTQAARADELIARIEADHPYETPAVVVLPITKGSVPYLDWIIAETTG